MSPATDCENKELRLFAYENELKNNHSARLYIAGVSFCLLLLLTASFLLAAPLKLQGNNSPTWNTISEPVVLSDNEFLRPTSKRCVIEVYQTSQKCKVSCVGISSGTDEPPGQIIVQDIKKLYESYSDTCISWTIFIKNTKFPDGKIDRNWFIVENEENFPPITGLEIEECPGLTEMEGGALANFPFGPNLETLVLARNSDFTILADGMTDGLEKLKSFQLRENGLLKHVGWNLFSPFENTVEVVQIQGGAESPQMFAKLLGSCQENPLSKLQVAELSFSEGAGMQQLGAYQISAMQRVESLYMHQSGIEVIDVDAFRGINTFLVSLSLANNKLETLPAGIFDGMGETRRTILYLADNNWRCDCHMQWLQKLLNESNAISLIDDAKCQSPESERGKSLHSANFSSTCPQMPSQPPQLEQSCLGTTSTIEISTQTTPLPTSTLSDVMTSITVPETTTSPESECKDLRSQLSLRRKVFKPMKTSRFNIEEVGDDNLQFAEVEINTGDGPAMSLVWHYDDENLNCWRGVTGVVRVGGLLKGKAYVFCLFEEGGGIESPTQCQGKSTRASWEERAWIENDERTFWMAMFIVIAVGCIAAGAGVTLFTIWRVPSRKAKLTRVNSHLTGTAFRPVLPPKPAAPPNRVNRINSTSYLSIWSASDISALKFKLCSWFNGMEDEHCSPHNEAVETLSCLDHLQDDLDIFTDYSQATYI